MSDLLHDQIENNFKAFEQKLPNLLPTHRGKFALMRDGEIIEFFDTARDAFIAGQKIYDKNKLISFINSIPVIVYFVDLLLPFGSTGFLIQGTQVMEFIPRGGSPFQMLLGRDIICRGTFTMSFDGHFTFSI